MDAAAAKALIDTLDAPPRLDIMGHVRAAAAEGMHPFELIRDMLRVIRGPGRLTPHEYFYYRLYDQTLARDEARRYVGKRAQNAFHAACNDLRWYAVAHDKALFYAAAAGYGLPVPRTRAVYAPGVRTFGAETIRTPEALAAFLSNAACYPMFVKPIDGIYSLGVLSLAALEHGRICLTTGEAASLEAVVGFVTGFGGAGFLLQDRLEPHPALRQAFGATLPTVRFLVLLAPDGAAVESAVLKIPSARNPADNYWRAGNLLGALDRAGTLMRAMTGIGAAVRDVATHPDTGATLNGLAVPDWERARELCQRAATVFPGIRTQSWDVAITDAGPVLLEVNFGGDLNLHQLAHRRGALTPSYAEHVKRCGYRRLR
ncbi:MAG: sugar-transfer associated ATP-grasp domain-containing protein [Acetobacteraceae bacterium]